LFIKQSTSLQTYTEPINTRFTQQNNMVCSLCNCDGHNKTTCPFRVSPAEKRIAAELGEMLPPVQVGVQRISELAEVAEEVRRLFETGARLAVVTKKENKPLEGLAGCKNIFKEPKVITVKKTKKIKKIKKVKKPLEGLSGCGNIFKEPKVITVKKTKKIKKIKKVKKPLEGLSGCGNIFKEPKAITVTKTSKTCSGCGEKGHNTRSCVNVCLPCSPPKAYCFAGLSGTQAVNLARIMDCTPVY